MAYNEIRTINNIQLEDIKARQSIQELDNKKANKSDIVNGLNFKGTTTYSALPTSDNSVGDFYYVTDGDGTNGEGNYAWNGTAWYFSGKTTDFGDISTKANAAVNNVAFKEGKLKVTKNDGTSTETEVIDSSLTKSGKAADAKITGDEIGQLKEDLAAITPDDNAVDGKPWTSKKTVDSLCMPTAATGNPVQVYPVDGYPLGVKVSWEPTQKGSGAPSPDNIRPITGRDAVSVTRCGKNLVDFPHNVKVSTLANTSKYYIVELNGIKDVILQWKFTGTAGNTAGCLSIRYNDGSNETVAYWGNSIGSKKITKAANRLELIDWTGLNGDMVIEYVQIEPGDTATPYEPYTGDTYTAELPETIYGGELDWNTGVLTVTHVQIASYAGEMLPGEWISDRDVYSSGTVPTTGAQVVYKLADPYTIQLSPQQIAALSGVNTLYTDAGTLTVTGREDPQHTITELKNAIISLGGNI